MWVVLKHHNKSLEAKIADTDKKTETVTNELNTLKEQQDGSTDTVKTFDLSAAKAEVIENNKKEIIYYNLLSFNIPRSTWITHFYTNSKGAVSISGKTSSTNNVYLFFKGIKSSVENSDLALTKLKYSTGFEDEIVKTNHVLYDFELSNAQYAALNNTVDETSASSNKGLSGALNQAQELIQQKIDDVKNAVKTEKTPDLPPIEDIKTNSDNKKNEKITKEDVDNIQKQREAKGAVKSSSNNKSENSTENTANPALPELPNLED